MITLLMVLFIVLFAMGQTDIRKFNAFKDSFHELSQQSQANAPPGGPGILSQPSAIALLEQNPYAKLDSSSATWAGGEKQENGERTRRASRPTGSPRLGRTPTTYPPRLCRPTANRQKGAAAEKLALSKALLAMEKALDKAGLDNEVSSPSTRGA